MSEQLRQDKAGAWRVAQTRTVRPVANMSADVQQLFVEVVEHVATSKGGDNNAETRLSHELDQRIPRCGALCIRSARVYTEATHVHQPGYELHCFPPPFKAEESALEQSEACAAMHARGDGAFLEIMTRDRD